MADAGANKSGLMAVNKAYDGLLFSGLEVGTMFTSQRKNVEAVMQAHRVALDGVQAVWRRQLDFFEDAVEGLSTRVGALAPPSGALNEGFAKHTEYSKQAFEKNLANAREITAIATKATSDAANIISQRFCESFGEMPYPGKAER